MAVRVLRARALLLLLVASPALTCGVVESSSSGPARSRSHEGDISSTEREVNPRHSARPRQFRPFVAASVTSDQTLDGSGTNIDSVAFWQAPDPEDTLLFVSSRDDHLVQVWKYPFAVEAKVLIPPVESGGILRRLVGRKAEINGVCVDQDNDKLYVTETVERNRVFVYSLPDLLLLDVFGQGILGSGETNLTILDRPDPDTKWIYVSDDHQITAFEEDTYTVKSRIRPPVDSIEELLADDFYQVIYVPDEQGGASSHGQGISAFHPDGAPYTQKGNNKFGVTQFQSDEEGIVLYTCPHSGESDDGRGFIIVSDQRMGANDFEVFDRRSWQHLGRFRIEGVEETDGIASTQFALPGYPKGLFAAVDHDSTVALVSWQKLIDATGLRCSD